MAIQQALGPKEAGIAQSVEQLIRNEKVGGSIPLSGTKKIKHSGQLARVGLFVSRVRVATSTGFCTVYPPCASTEGKKKPGTLAGLVVVAVSVTAFAGWPLPCRVLRPSLAVGRLRGPAMRWWFRAFLSAALML